MQNKNNNLTYWWNLPIDELEEMADENGKIKKESMNMSKEEMKANILKKKKISFKSERSLKLSKIKLGNLQKYVLKEHIQKMMFKWHIIFKTNILM